MHLKQWGPNEKLEKHFNFNKFTLSGYETELKTSSRQKANNYTIYQIKNIYSSEKIYRT